MLSLIVAAITASCAIASGRSGRPVPSANLQSRIRDGLEIYGIVHWGLNTFTDREWGYGDEDPAMLDPAKFDADQIVGACKAGGLQGLVVVAKHHDGFCLWPSKTTEHNITKSPFWRGKGTVAGSQGRDYVKEMEQACRRAGLKFGVYCSPWDRNSAHYATDRYVDIYHAQLKELLSGAYGEVFEMWFDGANGGDGYYGGARDRRKIGAGYYRFDEVFSFVRALQPGAAIFCSEDSAEMRWPGNERGVLDPDSRATIDPCGGVVAGKYGNPNFKSIINTGLPEGSLFKMCEADFPLRKGWFYHEKERGTTKSSAYLVKLYLSSVGNGGTMNIGIAPTKDGILDADDVKALAGFKALKDALFAHEVKQGEEFNVVVMREDLTNGEQVDGWEFVADGKPVLSGKSIGVKRIRILETPCSARSCEVRVTKDGGAFKGVSFSLYHADPELVKLVLSSTTESGETDTAKWMTSGASAGGVEKWDPNMAVKSAVVTNGMKWIDGKCLPIEGRAFDDVDHWYDRLPSNVTTNVNGGVRNMKHHTSGMLYRFTTDSRRLEFMWTPYSANLSMDHMPATGVSGIDVYRWDAAKSRWMYVKTGRINNAKKGGSLSIAWKPGTPCLVNLPLYNGVKTFSLGIETNATVKALPPRASGINKPVVFYGTSITHGGCCSRPGLAFVNRVGRDLDVPVVGLGFSGSGFMELEMSEHLARIDASCYVLDCLWNMAMSRAGVECGRCVDVNYEPFIRNLRAKRPGVPIVMAEQCDVFCAGPNSKDSCIKALYDKLVSEGWKDLVYLPKDGMYSGDLEGTVDGVHPNDLGMESMAKAFGRAVRLALNL